MKSADLVELIRVDCWIFNELFLLIVQFHTICISFFMFAKWLA